MYYYDYISTFKFVRKYALMMKSLLYATAGENPLKVVNFRLDSCINPVNSKYV